MVGTIVPPALFSLGQTQNIYKGSTVQVEKYERKYISLFHLDVTH